MRYCSVDGCTRKHQAKGYCHTHWQTFVRNTPEYNSWRGMKNRCYTTSSISYKDYGGRGIIVCERWRNSFKNFLEDMGYKPTRKHSIERVDVNGNYEPSNCRWATAHEQAANMSYRKPDDVPGVFYHTVHHNWIARLKVKGKMVLDKEYKNKDDAIKARKSAELEWLGFNI
jgi:hypothetical protein